jgi:hypothetical protein
LKIGLFEFKIASYPIHQPVFRRIHLPLLLWHPAIAFFQFHQEIEKNKIRIQFINVLLPSEFRIRLDCLRQATFGLSRSALSSQHAEGLMSKAGSEHVEGSSSQAGFPIPIPLPVTAKSR